MNAKLATRKARLVTDPPIAKFLFNSTKSAPLWLALRVWIGLDWFYAGFEKATGTGWLSGRNPAARQASKTLGNLSGGIDRRSSAT